MKRVVKASTDSELCELVGRQLKDGLYYIAKDVHELRRQYKMTTEQYDAIEHLENVIMNTADDVCKMKGRLVDHE